MSFDMKSNLNDKVADEFIDSQAKKGTFITYKCQLKQYLKWTGKSGQELIDIKRNDKDFQVENSLLAYRKHLLSLGKSENYAVGSIMAIRSFYAYCRVPLVLRKQESRKLAEKSRTTTDFLFDREDLSKMALAGNLKDRYVLIVGKSIGLRASDFVKLTFGQLRSLKLDGEAPIALGEIQTQKERIKAYPFLDSDAVPIVKMVLEANKDKSDDERVLTDTEDNLSRILQILCKKAGMDIDEHGMIHNRRVRMHCLRKYLIDHISALASESQWKQIVGKTISEGAYVSQDQLRGIYSRAMPNLLINGNGAKTRKLIELEDALLDSQRKITNLETTNEVLRERLDELESGQNTTKELVGNLTERISYIEKKTKIHKPYMETTR